MKKITTQLKSALHHKDSIEERLHLLKDKYKDETAYIITCGPSLSKHDVNLLKFFLFYYCSFSCENCRKK